MFCQQVIGCLICPFSLQSPLIFFAFRFIFRVPILLFKSCILMSQSSQSSNLPVLPISVNLIYVFVKPLPTSHSHPRPMHSNGPGPVLPEHDHSTHPLTQLVNLELLETLVTIT